MANLYCKVKSDIRAGIGCRGKSHLDAVLCFSYDGRNKPDGLAVFRARHHGDTVDIVVDVYPDSEATAPTHVITMTFNRDGSYVVREKETDNGKS